MSNDIDWANTATVYHVGDMFAHLTKDDRWATSCLSLRHGKALDVGVFDERGAAIDALEQHVADHHAGRSLCPACGQPIPEATR